MLNLISKITVVVVVFVLIGIGGACSVSTASQSKEIQEQKAEAAKNQSNQNMPSRFTSDDPNTLPTPDNQTKGFMAETAQAGADEASMLAGVWRMTYRNGVCQVQAEMVFQPNGSYSGYTQCSDGSYAFHAVGNWRILQSGAVRIQYTDYSPKEFMGNRIRIPDGETMYYRFLDRNRLGFSGNVVAFRAQ